MVVTEDKRDRIERLVRADPTLTAVEMGRVVGLTRQRVHQILKALGYELHTIWRKSKDK